ncbi:P-loop containing nucleoside triphosphate hydrolase protein [Rhexocercosporidium sp. MPI-PUGE-AT-0058]|nr:P-loop containing nucleoside triphosphate hydrolase protein [Rhexocercosporidium sp. MPI-PUGE-AT-0058]
MADDRADVVLEYALPLIKTKIGNQSQGEKHRPFVLGVTGLQGSGKSHLAAALVQELRNKHQYNAIEVSLDDFYLPHSTREDLRQQNPDNKLLSARGQPGTHDVVLAREFFEQFEKVDCDEIWIPSFDKSLFQGDGDRLPTGQWKTVKGPVDVVVFEGWCVGFRPLAAEGVEEKMKEAVNSRASEGVASKAQESDFSTSTLADHELKNLLWVNEQLGSYCKGFMGPQNFDFFVHLDTDELANVYAWRVQQEHALLERKGSGMSDEQVVKFVQVYMPAYELYLDGLRRGFFSEVQDGKGKQIRLVMDIKRNVTKAEIL